jgi:hypothetical protein
MRVVSCCQSQLKNTGVITSVNLRRSSLKQMLKAIMPKLLFVHGTGVRYKRYSETLKLIEEKIGAYAEIIPCYWGDLGSSLGAQGRSIPTYDSARHSQDLQAGAVDSGAYRLHLWQALLADPLYELRALTLKPRPERHFSWEETQGSKLIQTARQLELSAELRELLLAGGIKPMVFEEAMREVSSSVVLPEALTDADEDLAESRAAIARAWIAAAAKRLHDATLEETGEWAWPAIALDGERRSQLESQLIDALGGDERGLGDWVMEKVSWPLLQGWLTWEGVKRRGAISDATYPIPGDIVLYQARGEAIRARIRDRILAAQGPVHVLAPSLGSVACVELLAMEPLPVQHLITVGSQAPFL